MLLHPIAVMRCVPLFTRDAHITCKANITSAGQHHVPLKRNTSFKKAPFVRQTKDAFLLAEKERFELSNGLWPLRDFQSRALDQTRRLLHLQLYGFLRCFSCGSGRACRSSAKVIIASFECLVNRFFIVRFDKCRTSGTESLGGRAGSGDHGPGCGIPPA